MGLMSDGTKVALAGVSWQFYAAIGAGALALIMGAGVFHFWTTSSLKDSIIDTQKELTSCIAANSTLTVAIADQNNAVDRLALDAAAETSRADAAAATELRQTERRRRAALTDGRVGPVAMNAFLKELF